MPDRSLYRDDDEFFRAQLDELANKPRETPSKKAVQSVTVDSSEVEPKPTSPSDT